MTGLDIIYLVFSLACTILSASFASREIAFMNLQRIRLRHLQVSHVHSTDRVAKTIESPYWNEKSQVQKKLWKRL